MAINFIPNDPDAVAALPMRKISPRPNRPATKAGYVLGGAVAEGQFPPGSAEFLFWQCREGALAALASWEAATGSPFKRWQPGKKLRLLQDAGEDLNAFYDRASLSFFHATDGSGETFFSGASTDVVAHEAGHGILDAARPDFWDSTLFEVNSFHEAFGDCVAILTALQDKATRETVVAGLTAKNVVEATAENLARGIGAIAGANHNAAAPRRARNKFKHVLPETLPDFGSPADGPGVLINEIHSFGQIFSGCLYDTIVNVFEAGTSKTEAALLKATNLVGRLLSRAAVQAPQRPRYFREVGRAMVLADQALNGGANGTAIHDAFLAHDILLGSAGMLAPLTSLDGGPPKLGGGLAKLAASVKKDLLHRLGAVPRARSIFRSAMLGAEEFGEFTHQRMVPLGELSSRLRGVMAMAPETVLVGESGGKAAVLGSMPQADNTAVEVQNFVHSLLKRGSIAFASPAVAAKSLLAKGAAKPTATPVTHAIKTVGDHKVLVRLRFACRSGAHHCRTGC